MKSIQEVVIEDLQARMKLGEERYGHKLYPHDGRDSLLDLYEELCDALFYTRTIRGK